MIYHQFPHPGTGEGGGEISVAGDFDGVGEIPRVSPIKQSGDDCAEAARND